MNSEEKTTRELIGETFLDLGKLTFAGSALSGVFEHSFDNPILILAGFAISILLICMGIYLIVTKKTKMED